VLPNMPATARWDPRESIVIARHIRELSMRVWSM